jgi:hypothetical protein
MSEVKEVVVYAIKAVKSDLTIALNTLERYEDGYRESSKSYLNLFLLDDDLPLADLLERLNKINCEYPTATLKQYGDTVCVEWTEYSSDEDMKRLKIALNNKIAKLQLKLIELESYLDGEM